MALSRAQRIRNFGSPVFDYSPTLTAGGIYAFYPKQQDAEAKYFPFDKFVIQNNSSSDIEVKLRTSTFYVFAGTSREETNYHFEGFKITELSGAATNAGEIRIEISRRAMDADKKAAEEAITDPIIQPIKKLLSFGGI